MTLFTNYLFQMDSIMNIYYSIINFNDIFTLILYMMDELMKYK